MAIFRFPKNKGGLIHLFNGLGLRAVELIVGLYLVGYIAFYGLATLNTLLRCICVCSRKAEEHQNQSLLSWREERSHNFIYFLWFPCPCWRMGCVPGANLAAVWGGWVGLGAFRVAIERGRRAADRTAIEPKKIFWGPSATCVVIHR